jgi:hypothetical protein
VPGSRDTKSTGEPASSNFCTGFSKMAKYNLSPASTRNTKLDEIQHIVGKVITKKIYRGMQINLFVDHPKYLAISTYESSEPIPGS